MEITEVRIKLIDNVDDRLRGFCSVTFDDCFVVRDLKIIEGDRGYFIAMPSRKLTGNCQKCRSKNHLRANYCNHCGNRLKQERIEVDADGRAKLYADVAHPVNAKCREKIQSRVVEELQRELELAAQPGYHSRYDDDYFDDDPGPHAAKSEQKKADPVEDPDEATLEETPSEKGDSIRRVDDGAENQSNPHNPDDISTHDAKSGDDEFGQGIF